MKEQKKLKFQIKTKKNVGYPFFCPFLGFQLREKTLKKSLERAKRTEWMCETPLSLKKQKMKDSGKIILFFCLCDLITVILFTLVSWDSSFFFLFFLRACQFHCRMSAWTFFFLFSYPPTAIFLFVVLVTETPASAATSNETAAASGSQEPFDAGLEAPILDVYREPVSPYACIMVKE